MAQQATLYCIRSTTDLSICWIGTTFKQLRETLLKTIVKYNHWLKNKSDTDCKVAIFPHIEHHGGWDSVTCQILQQVTYTESTLTHVKTLFKQYEHYYISTLKSVNRFVECASSEEAIPPETNFMPQPVNEVIGQKQVTNKRFILKPVVGTNKFECPGCYRIGTQKAIVRHVRTHGLYSFNYLVESIPKVEPVPKVHQKYFFETNDMGKSICPVCRVTMEQREMRIHVQSNHQLTSFNYETDSVPVQLPPSIEIEQPEEKDGTVHGIVYCFQSMLDPDIRYVGRTTQTLDERIRSHKSGYTRWMNGNDKGKTTLFPYVRDSPNGWDDFTVSTLEEGVFPSTEAFAKREEYHRTQCITVNRCMAIDDLKGACEHRKLKFRCKECGKGYCPCGKQKRTCLIHGGSQMCKAHGVNKATCVKCNGASVCPHGNKRKTLCRECPGGGGALCPLGAHPDDPLKQHRTCKECAPKKCPQCGDIQTANHLKTHVEQRCRALK
jgi:hypothetical protein